MRGVGLGLLVMLVLGAWPGAGWAEPGPAAEPSTVTLEVGDRIRFSAPADQALSVSGHGPHRGVIEVRRSASGLQIVNEVDLESYTLGIREVPGMWPMEALKAQAVAARTYGLWEQQAGRWADDGYDICPTQGCQVFRGSEADGEPGRRWAEAVRATRGQVLVDAGGPALTRYHASSGGRTLPNHVVYPGSSPRAYLMGIDDPDDAVSPLHAWTATFTFQELEAVLRTGFGFTAELIDIAVDPASGTAVVHSADILQYTDVARLRAVINQHAPRLFPDRYPGPRADGERMPVTLPSARFEAERSEDGFVLRGRGHGHGVGMSQWGAMGRAARGESYTQILAAYYGGLSPVAWNPAATIRVGIDDSVSQVSVQAAGPFVVTSPAGDLETQATGAWTVRPGNGGTLVVTRPAPAPSPTPETQPTPVPTVPPQVAVQPATVTTADPAPALARPTAVGVWTIAAAGLLLRASGRRLWPTRRRNPRPGA